MSRQEQCVRPGKEFPRRTGCAPVALCGCGADPDRLHRGAPRWAGRAQGVRGEANRVLAVVALRLQ
eukprot:12361730-Prorocentrum_lima.AAC.1